MTRPALITLLLLLVSGFVTHAQREELKYKEYEDLLILYMDEKYEKIISKCEGGGLFPGIIEKERKQPMPYLYLSKAYYEISKMEEYKNHEDYRRAFKEAMKYAGRFVDKDERQEMIGDHQRYLSNLRKDAFEKAQVLYEQAQYEPRNYRMARYYYDKVADFSPKDPSPLYMSGLTEIKQGIGRQAERTFQEAGKKLNALGAIDELQDEQQELLTFFFREYSEHLMDEGMQDSAKATLELGYPLLEKDEEFMKEYQKVAQ